MDHVCTCTHPRTEDQPARMQGSDNDVRIFQLVQECQLNGSSVPSVVPLNNGVTAPLQPLPQAAPTASERQQCAADQTVDVHAVGQSPFNHSKSKSQVDSLNHSSTVRKECSEQKCYSRATIKDTQSSGHSPVDTLHTGSLVPVAAHRQNQLSEVCTVVDSQSGSGNGTEGNVPSGDCVGCVQAAGHSDPQQCSLAAAPAAAPGPGPTAPAAPVPDLVMRAAPDSSQHQPTAVVSAADRIAAILAGTAAGMWEQASHHAEAQAAPVVAEAPHHGKGQDGTWKGDDPAVQHMRAQPPTPPEPLHDEVTADERHTSNVEQDVDCGHEQSEDELDGFLPTQIDGLEAMAPMDAVEPAGHAEALPSDFAHTGVLFALLLVKPSGTHVGLVPTACAQSAFLLVLGFSP